MKKLAVLAALQVGFILGWAGWHERVWAEAPTFRIPLRPVDPYDVMRGRYFILNPADGSVSAGGPDTLLATAALVRFLGTDGYYNGPALVGFCAVGDVQRVCDLRRGTITPPGDGRFWSRVWATIHGDGRAAAGHGYVVSLDFGLDRFFLPNRLQLPGRENEPGWELEVSYRPAQNLLPRRLWFKGQPVK